MAKKTSTGKATAPAASASSIDDIFAKPSGKAPPPAHAVASSSKSSATQPTQPVSSGDQKKKKKQKKKEATRNIATFDPEDATPADTGVKAKSKPKTAGPTSEPTSRAVEVVEDPSLAQIAAAVKAAKATAVTGAVVKVKKRAAADEEDEMFRDSRGTGPRRKTEEGFLIYKEAELSIDPTAGGTPLCPFDCDCCF